MIAWGLFLAWSGQKYNAKKGTLSFRKDLVNNSLPWFTGASWGTATLVEDEVLVEVAEGSVHLESVEFQGDTYLKDKIENNTGDIRRFKKQLT